ncbi:hypothetical protein J6590_084621 [Homalodisca vitripennis]|nr:hypothetical protein J6590_084621 [Homalodisca vitripennis]
MHLAIPSPVAGNAPYRVEYLSEDSPETGAHMNGETPHYQRPKVQPLPPRVRPQVSGPAGWGKPAGGTPDPAVPVSLTALVGRVPPHCRQGKTRLARSRQGGTPHPHSPSTGENPLRHRGDPLDNVRLGRD